MANSNSDPDHEEVKTLYDTLEGFIDDLRSDLALQTLQTDPYVLLDVVKKYVSDIDHFHKLYNIEPDEFKKAGYWTFWIRKLKPVHIVNPQEQARQAPVGRDLVLGWYINEFLAVSYSLGVLRVAIRPRQQFRLTPHLWRELVYGLRYRAISPHGMALFYEALATNTVISER